jgi:hypothetical protein
MLVICKPTIEYTNLTKDYKIVVFPVSEANGEDIEEDDVTYSHVLDWVYNHNQDWVDASLEYIEKISRLRYYK